MPRSRPFKKDLTPLRKGGSVKVHTGKGSTEQSTAGGQPSTLSGGDPYAGAANRYPKPSTEDLAPPEDDTPSPPVPMGTQPARMPTANMPGGGDDDGDEAA